MTTYKLYAAGQFLESELLQEVVNPYNNQVFAKVFFADANILESAILSALQAANALIDRPLYKRSEALNDIADGIAKERNEFAKLIALESAKPLQYALGEVDRAIQTYRIAAEESKRPDYSYMRLDWTAAGEGKEGLVRRFPIGLVAGISPFNFPLNLTAHKLAPAIAAGNPIILKPSSRTPVSILKLAEIIDKTNLPEGAVSILPMSRELGDRLVTDDRIKLISFTGSPAVGWDMKSNAGKKRVLLELGGNAGVYVSETADVDVAATKCAIGGFAFSGQVCIHVQRIYVHEKAFDKFMNKFSSLVSQIRAGDPLDPDTEIAEMIDENNARRVEEWVHDAVKAGARIVCGGNRSGNYFPPTVLTETHNHMKVCALEIFGPVVTLQAVKSIEEATELINDSRYGLQAGVFTDSITEMQYVYRNLEVGGVIINDIPTFRVDHMPYGGVKDSGFGREGIRYAMDEMTEPRLLVKPM